MLAINKINHLRQGDILWGKNKIGNSPVDLAHYGCLITCISMMSQFFGCYKSPAEIASEVKWFNTLGSFIWINSDFDNMSFRWREGTQSSMVKKEVLDMEMIKSYLAHGDNRPSDYNRAVILQVNNESHWVLGLWETNGDFKAIDPWSGKDCDVLSLYKNITGAALFVKWNKDEHNGKQAWQVLGKPEAPDYF